MYVETGLSASHSISAEESIITPLLEFDIFENISIQRMLTQYPHLNFQNKTSTVKLILKELWDQFIDDSIFDHFEKFDKVLSIIGIRGHFVHQFEVFLLGLYFLNFINDKQQFFEKEEFGQAVNIWLIVATAHDFGYPIQGGAKSLSKIGDMYSTFGFDDLATTIKDCSEEVKSLRYKELSTILNKEFVDNEKLNDFLAVSLSGSSSLSIDESYNILEDFLKDNDHGFASCCILANLIPKESFEGVGIKEVFGKAFSAIALHNYDKYTKENVLSSKKNIFSVILFIIDNIQDWSRDILKEINLSTCMIKKVSASKESNLIELEFFLDHQRWTDDLINSTRSWLEGKTDKLKNISDTSDRDEISLSLKYVTSKGDIIFSDIVGVS